MAEKSTCPHCGAQASAGTGKRLTCASCHRPLTEVSKTAAAASALQPASPARTPTVRQGVSRGYRKSCGNCGADLTFAPRRKLEDGSYLCESCERGSNETADEDDNDVVPMQTCQSCGDILDFDGICGICEFRNRMPTPENSKSSRIGETARPAQKSSSTRWIGIGIVAAVLIIGVSTWIIISPRWEESHLDQIMSMRATAMQLYGADKTVDSYHAFQSLFAFVGDRAIKTPYVVEQLDTARSTMEQAYAKAKPMINLVKHSISTRFSSGHQ